MTDLSYILNHFIFMPSFWAMTFIIIFRLIFKTKEKRANKIMFWYALVMFVIRVIYTLKLIFIPEEISPGIEATLSDYINRMTGPYWWSFTSQYFGPFLFIIPFLFRKLRYKTRWIFLSIISMCFGAWFERFIITITSIHRDLITESSANQSFWLKVFSPITIEKVIIGLVYASLIFFISEYYKDQKNQHEVLDN